MPQTPPSSGHDGEGSGSSCNAERGLAPHIAWAALIKEQHRHLQRAVHTRTGHNSTDGGGGRTDYQASDSEDGGRWSGPGPTVTGDSDNDDLALWRRAVENSEEQGRLQGYASAMYHLATRYWEAPLSSEVGEEEPPSRKRNAEGELTDSGVPVEALRRRRYNDRVAWSLNCVSEHYLGVARNTGGVADGSECADRTGLSLFTTLPLIFSRALKPLRREFYAQHQRMATALEVEGELLEKAGRQQRTEGPSGGDGEGHAWGVAMRYVHAMRAQREGAVGEGLETPLYALDVGSCYGPFAGKSLLHTALGMIPLHVVALDLAPYCDESQSQRVLRGDWLNMKFFSPNEPDSTDEAASLCGPSRSPGTGGGAVADGRVRVKSVSVSPARAEKGTVPPEAISVAVESFDVVFFCLLLSYLPTARLRYLACLHAALALRQGGLLVIVSTRTQGSHRATWVRDWVECMTSIGFIRVHQSIREHIVGLSFEKKSIARLETPEDRQRWVVERMATEEAATGFRIMADEQL